MLTIRPAEVKDCHWIIKLIEEYPTLIDRSVKDWLFFHFVPAISGDPNSYVYVIPEKAFLYVKVLGDGETISLQLLISKQKGGGTALIHHLIEKWPDTPFILATNTAVGFYKKFGFIDLGDLPDEKNNIKTTMVRYA